MLSRGPVRMGFRFKKKENFDAGFHRIADEQIARALADWARKDRAVAVHETRKCLKRLRSLLRLVRPALSPRDYKKENANLRDIARELSTSRDAQVMRETIELLRQEAGPAEQEALDSLSDQVAIVHSHVNSNDQGPDAEHTAAALRKAGQRLKKLSVKGQDFEVVSPGFQSTYRQGRKAMAKMQVEYDEEASHEWRKRVQAHWRQLTLLSGAWPEFFESRIALARRLSDVLGQDHDLAVLLAFAQGPASEALGEDGLSSVSQLIKKRQKELGEQALRDGEFLYADRPGGLNDRVRSYWAIAAKRPKTEVVPYRPSKPEPETDASEPAGAASADHAPAAQPRVAAPTKSQAPNKPVRRQTMAKKAVTRTVPMRKPKAIVARQAPIKT